MISCDDEVMISPKVGYRVPTVFDNLIARKEMPVTIGVFINPGDLPDAPPGQQHRANRSLEYDSLGDAYARFLLEEIVPEVSKEHHLTKDPAGWAVCGNSSGGICAFTAAWERPDRFGKVVSHIGSFTNIRGGYVHPFLIRRTKEDGVGSPEDQAKLKLRRKIRIFLQDGSGDLDNDAGKATPTPSPSPSSPHGFFIPLEARCALAKSSADGRGLGPLSCSLSAHATDLTPGPRRRRCPIPHRHWPSP